MAEAPAPVEIFCCYSRKDETWLRKLETHLSLLKRQGLVSLWSDRLIAPGADWAKAIDTHLETASVILLLVSADLLASDYCYSIEMKRALERDAAGEARVVPILVRPVDWKDAPFAHLQALPANAKPVASWRSKDRALVDVAAGIRRVIEDMPLLAASASRTALPAIWNIPYPRNPFFLGRDAELAQLRQNLQAGQATALSQPQAISGLGGIGKSQLALEYAYRYHQDYHAVLWTRAESTEALISSYVALARLLRLPEREAKEQDITVQAVKIWLQTHRDWLLILDNADELTLLLDFLPPTLGGHLLLTTRATATGRLAQRLEVETLLPEHGALFLLRRAALLAPDAELSQASPQVRTLALQISQELDGLPLALDQAGAYLEEAGTDLTSYWHIYQQHRADLLRRRGGLAADHPKPVATTWSLSFEQVAQDNPAAGDLLRLCAFLAPDVIPQEILTEGAKELGDVLAPVAADIYQLDQTITALRAYSLLARDPQTRTLSIHRLVQVVLRDALSVEEQTAWMRRTVKIVNATFPNPEHVAQWSACERWLPHALICITWIKQEQMTFPEATDLLFQTGSYLYERARYGEAEPLYQYALAIREQQLGIEHSLVAVSLNALANLYKEQGRYSEAELLYQRALRIWRRQLGPEHLQTAYSLHGLATIYKEQGKYAKAELLYRRAITIREQQLGPEHPLVAKSLNALANLYKAQGKYPEAELLYQRALAIREQQLGSEHPQIAYPLNNLANLYYKQDKYLEAEPLYQRALRIWKQQFGPEHPKVASALNNLADLYCKQGNYAEAEPLYQKALCIKEQQLGLQHPQVAYPLHGLANLYREQGRYVEAELLYQQALAIREQQLGLEHPLVATSLNGLANLYLEQGRYVEAEQFFQHTLHIREQALGCKHPETAEAMHDLARLWDVLGNSAEARNWYARTLAVRELAFGAQHPKTIETRTRLIGLFNALGQHVEAAQLEAAQSEP